MSNEAEIYEKFYQRNMDKEEILVELLRMFVIKETIYNAEKDLDFEMESYQKERFLYLIESHKDIIIKSLPESIDYMPKDLEFVYQLILSSNNADIFELMKFILLGKETAFRYEYLYSYYSGYFKKEKSIMICEFEKFLYLLSHKLKENVSQIYLTTENILVFKLSKYFLKGFDESELIYGSIYNSKVDFPKVDVIISKPSKFGYEKFTDEKYASDYREFIAIEKLSSNLNENGVLNIWMPEELILNVRSREFRKYLLENYYLESMYLSDDMLINGEDSNWYEFEIFNKPVNQDRCIKVGNFVLEDGIGEEYTFHITNEEYDVYNFECIEKRALLIRKDIKKVSISSLKIIETWSLSTLIQDIDKDIIEYKQSNVPKVKLSDKATIFRGKAINKNEIVSDGNYKVINISNIEDGKLLIDSMETIKVMNERAIHKFKVKPGDLIITSRGTTYKMAVVANTDEKLIASGNLLVVRPDKEYIAEFLKVFLQSTIGIKLLKIISGEGAVNNINAITLGELEIPVMDVGNQEAVVKRYNDNFDTYRNEINQATKKYEMENKNILNGIINDNISKES